MNKKMNVKIKRSKNRLYRKRKSPGRKVLEGVLLVALIGGLGFLGYSVAEPVINYFKGDSSTSTITSWQPDESLISEINSSFNTGDISGNPSPASTAEGISTGIGSYLLSESDLADYTVLSDAVKNAKALGFTQVIIPMKNLQGSLLYKSNINYVKDTELVIGSMAAAQIVSAAKNNGVKAIAMIPVTYDTLTPAYVEDTGYRWADDSYGWLDNYEELGGKRWVDPYLQGTKNYYSDLAKELTGSGFEQVILSRLQFPEFMPYDQNILAERNFTENRYTILSTLYNTVDTAAGKKTAVEMDINDVLANYGTDFAGTAELLKDKSFSGTVYLKITLSDFGTSLKISDETSVSLPTDQVKKCTALIEKAAKYMGTNVTIIPVINPEGLSSEVVTACYKELMAE